MLDDLQGIVDGESGQTMAEYAVVLGVITIAVVVTLGLLSTATVDGARLGLGPCVLVMRVGRVAVACRRRRTRRRRP
jgi:Flp pilus assembly pilin Flp